MRLRRQLRQVQQERDILAKATAWLAANSAGVHAFCRVPRVSASGHYQWLRRAPSARQIANAVMTEAIRQVHRDCDETYGTPRVRAELQATGYRTSHPLHSRRSTLPTAMFQ